MQRSSLHKAKRQTLLALSIGHIVTIDKLSSGADCMDV